MDLNGIDFRKFVSSAVCFLVVVLSLMVAGCATDPSPKFTDDLDSLKRQVWSLEKQTAEVNLRLAQNNNEVALLGEKFKRLEDAVNGLRDSIIRASAPKAGMVNPGESAQAGVPEGLARILARPVVQERN
jgi:hypothetical protein